MAGSIIVFFNVNKCTLCKQAENLLHLAGSLLQMVSSTYQASPRRSLTLSLVMLADYPERRQPRLPTTQISYVFNTDVHKLALSYLITWRFWRATWALYHISDITYINFYPSLPLKKTCFSSAAPRWLIGPTAVTPYATVWLAMHVAFGFLLRIFM